MASARAPPVVAIDDQADAMAALDLALRHIDHVPEQAAERRAQDMQNFQAGRRDSAAAVSRCRRRIAIGGAAAANAMRPNVELRGRRSPMRSFLRIRFRLNLTPKC